MGHTKRKAWALYQVKQYETTSTVLQNICNIQFCVREKKSENDQWVCPQLQKNAEQDLRAFIRLHCATKSCLILSILEIFIKRLTKENKNVSIELSKTV